MSNTEARTLSKEARHNFRDQLRNARAMVLRDAEAFDEIVFVVERLGSYLAGKVGALGGYRQHFLNYVIPSPPAEEVTHDWRCLHTPFSVLYDMVTQARNDALHIGAFARHLTSHTIELSLIIEDALMEEDEQVGDYMVRDPVCAYLWQPLSIIRQAMLANSFSYLPVLVTEKEQNVWRVISDYALARHLRGTSKNERKLRLAQTLKDVLDSGAVDLDVPEICKSDTPITTMIEKASRLPILIQMNHTDDLIGIVTSFDLL